MNERRQKIIVIAFMLFVAVSLALMSNRDMSISTRQQFEGVFKLPLAGVRRSSDSGVMSAAEYLKKVEEVRKLTGLKVVPKSGTAQELINVAHEIQESEGVEPVEFSFPQEVSGTGAAAGFFSLASMWQATADPEVLTVAFMSQHYGDPGFSVALFGSGFSATGNTVYFDEYAIENIPSANGIQLIFNIPRDLAPKRYTVRVGNGKGMSEETTMFIVTRPGAALPLIKSVSPLTAEYGQEITITGSGFTKTGNDIYTSYKVITNVPSDDGKTLKFSVKPFEDTPEFQTQPYTYPEGELNGYPIFIGVINDNGIGFYQNPLMLNL